MDVLLIEDNPADVRLVREALAENAMPAVLHWLSSGEEALSFLRHEENHADSPAPDLVLLDLNLPGLHGHEVLVAIKQDPLLRHIQVVVLTSSAAQGDVLQAYRSHANAYVVKPEDFEKFLSLVGEIHSHWLQLVLLPSRVA